MLQMSPSIQTREESIGASDKRLTQPWAKRSGTNNAATMQSTNSTTSVAEKLQPNPLMLSRP